jgi:hypothetical protein|tara:strand:+ start:117 stop:545 length:429 start_codon:yes stop_codon:yes gene_type:complete
MIKYKLACKDCKITFDSWFASSKEYEKLEKKNFLVCHNCNSQKVRKTLMAPQLINNKNKSKNDLDLMKYSNIKKTIRSYQKFIRNNLKYVGENFAYEARSIHYEGNKKKKSIYGTASKQDLKELKEEGIDTQIIPWIDDVDN